MKQKELRNLAEKVAKWEMVIQNTTDSSEIAHAEKEIMRLGACAKTLDDMMAIDEMVMDILEKKKNNYHDFQKKI